MRELAYSILDVFAEQALEGNALAVFHDATGLTLDQMQALARETNLSETTFILPSSLAASERDHGVRVRIFTTEEELDFAGHPTLGTATWLYLNHPTLRGNNTITLQLNVGPILVAFTTPAIGELGLQATMRQIDPIFGATHDRAEVAKAIGLTEDDLLEGYAPQTVSTGMAFCIVPLKRAAIARLQMSQRHAQAWLHKNDAKFFYCIAPGHTRDQAACPHWHARMQFQNAEDPATGSGAGCCISWLVSKGLAPSGVPIVIEQGIEIKRPSRLTVQASLDPLPQDSTGAHVHSVLVSGRSIPVARGSFFLPHPQ